MGTLFLVLAPANSTEECKFFLYFKIFPIFFTSKFVIGGHGFEFEKLNHRLKHAIIMSLFLFHVCTKAGMVTKNEHFPLLVFTGYERTKHCRNKYSLIFVTALPVVLLCPKLVYQRSVGIFKKRERLFLRMDQIVTLQLIYVYSLYSMCTVVQQEID